MPFEAITAGALLPDARTSRLIQPSKPSPLAITTLASATLRASAGDGAYTWASLSGPTSVATSTRSPPTFFTRSPRIENVASTFSRSCAAAGDAATNTIAASRCRRVSMPLSRFEMALRQRLTDNTTDLSEQKRQHVEKARHQDDGRARRNAGVIGEEEPEIARRHAACGCDRDHQRDIARPDPPERRRQHHEAAREHRAERMKPHHQVARA